MNVSTMQARVFRRAFTTPDYTSSLAIEDLNVIVKDFWSSYVQSNIGRLNWEQWTDDTLVQSEYQIPKPTSSSIGAEILESVAITYDDDTYVNTGEAKYIKCNEVDPKTLPKDWSWYLENQPTSSPIFYRADDSIFIAPQPLSTQSGVDRIKLTGIRSIPDWTVSTVEADMKLPLHAIETIVYGWIWKAHEFENRDPNTVIGAFNFYEAQKAKSIEKMSTLVTGPFLNNFPA